ncbi:hypothetical protein [Roseobacter sp.]|uniref:hypothetical protein n=1 Tax=Roseobacter sp. TaxID=1907202 RepID=UPI00385ED341
MPRVFRLYIISGLIGFFVSAVFVAMIIGFNVGNLQHLIFTSDIGVIAVLAFWVLNGIVFSGAQFAFSLSQLAEHADDT